MIKDTGGIKMTLAAIHSLVATLLLTSSISGSDEAARNLDLMFLLDGSASNGRNFDDMKEWVVDVVSRFDIEEDTQVGVVQYSHWYKGIDNQPLIKTEVELGEYDDHTDFEAAVRSIPFQGYTTYTAHAINKTVQDFKSSDRFGEPTTKQVMVVLTSGGSTDAGVLPSAASYARSLGITIFAVGIGSEVDESFEELQTIANGEIGNNLRVFRGMDDSAIDTLARDITALWQDTTKEILFILDGSSSFGTDGFDRAKEMVKLVAQSTNERTHFGVIQYTHYSADAPISQQPFIVTEIRIGEFDDYGNFAAAVDRIQLQAYTTYTGRALQKVRCDFVATDSYGRENNEQFAVVVTDGRATDPALVEPNANALRRLGVTILSVGAGPKVNVEELRMIATGDASNAERVFLVGSTNDLPLIAEELTAFFNEY